MLHFNSGFDDYIAPFEARQVLGRLLNDDPRPHYVHASNIAETVGGDSLVYTWLNLALNGGGSDRRLQGRCTTPTPRSLTRL